MTSRNTRGLRIRTKCETLDELVRWFSRFCDEKSIFIATLAPRDAGLETAFSIDLATGTPALVGEGVVIASWATKDNRFGLPGMQVGIHRLAGSSAAVFEQLLVARAIATDAVQTPEGWDDGTDVNAPPFDDRMGTVAQDLASGAAVAVSRSSPPLAMPSLAAALGITTDDAAKPVATRTAFPSRPSAPTPSATAGKPASTSGAATASKRGATAPKVITLLPVPKAIAPPPLPAKAPRPLPVPKTIAVGPGPTANEPPVRASAPRIGAKVIAIAVPTIVPAAAGAKREAAAPPKRDAAKPAAAAQKPQPVATKPAAGARTPDPGVHEPQPVAAKPAAGARTPEPGVHEPQPVAAKPAAGARTPEPIAPEPQKPAVVDRTPEPIVQTPQPVAAKPAPAQRRATPATPMQAYAPSGQATDSASSFAPSAAPVAADNQPVSSGVPRASTVLGSGGTRRTPAPVVRTVHFDASALDDEDTAVVRIGGDAGFHVAAQGSSPAIEQERTDVLAHTPFLEDSLPGVDDVPRPVVAAAARPTPAAAFPAPAVGPTPLSPFAVRTSEEAAALPDVPEAPRTATFRALEPPSDIVDAARTKRAFEATQQVPRVVNRRARGIVIAAIALVAVLGGGVAAMVAMSSSEDTTPSSASSQPIASPPARVVMAQATDPARIAAPAEPAPTAAPAETALTAVATEPAPTAAATEPAPTAAATEPAPTAAPTEPAPTRPVVAPTEPAPTTPVAPTEPVPTTPAAAPVEPPAPMGATAAAPHDETAPAATAAPGARSAKATNTAKAKPPKAQPKRADAKAAVTKIRRKQKPLKPKCVDLSCL